MEIGEDANLGGEIAHTRFGTRCRCGVPERIRGRAGVIGGTPVLATKCLLDINNMKQSW